MNAANKVQQIPPDGGGGQGPPHQQGHPGEGGEPPEPGQQHLMGINEGVRNSSRGYQVR